MRDLLLQRPTPDIDIAVDGPVEPLGRRLADCLDADLRKTTDFMTATIVLPDGREIDLARTRSEYYPAPGALPVVTPADLQADLMRRDFTINAMAMQLAPERFGTLIDPLAAFEDLRARQLRVLHESSFVDDPTRLYRAVRFMLRLGFHLEAHTDDLLRRAVEQRRPALLSGARIRNELSAIFQQSPTRALGAIEELHLLEADGLRRASVEACEAAQSLPAAARALQMNLCAGAMAANLGIYCGLSRQDPLTLAVRLMLRRATRRSVRQAARLICSPPEALVTGGCDSELYFALQGTSPPAALALWTVLDQHARERLELYWRQLRLVSADIDGNDLAAVGCAPGPCFAAGLQAALQAKLDEGASPERQLAAAIEAAGDAANDTKPQTER